MSRVECMSVDDLRGRVKGFLGSLCTKLDVDDAIEILYERGYTVGQHTKPEDYDANGYLISTSVDDVNEFWPDNMLDLILEKQNARKQNGNFYNIQNSFVYKENRAENINVFSFEVFAQNESYLIAAALKLNPGDFIGYALDSKYIKIPNDLEYILKEFEIYNDDGDVIGYSSDADDYLYKNYSIEL